MTLRPLLWLPALLAGCATAPPEAPVHYICDEGKAFSVTYRSGDASVIEIEGMRFGLRREQAAVGERLSCDVLTLHRHGTRAMLEMEGRMAYRACREVRQ